MADKGWERENPATDLCSPSEKAMDGFVESQNRWSFHSENDSPLHPCCYPLPSQLLGKIPYFWAFLLYNNQNNRKIKESINSNHRQIEIVCKVF